MSQEHGIERFEALGRSWTAQYSFAAFIEAERELDGRDFMEILQKPGFADLATLFGACLRKHQPDLTFEGVCELIDEIGLARASETIQSVVAASMVGRQGAEGNPKPGRKGRQTG